MMLGTTNIKYIASLLTPNTETYRKTNKPTKQNFTQQNSFR